MSPFEIDILLHYYTRVVDHPHMRQPPPIWRETVDAFKRDGLLEDAIGESDRCYRLAERGQVFVRDGLLTVPLPVWRMPKVPK